ncbi:MAG: response regulator transcription factor [Acidimicrobiales bacterium]|nr:response regulator transcription factor [Acidimicrobiales bacterium]
MTLAFGDLHESAPALDTHPTILVIDGDSATRDSLAATLSVEGFDIVVAADGDEGVVLASAAHPSLILLDMGVGGNEDGLGVFHRLNASTPAVPIIMVTARDDELDAVLALEAGAADHVTKPPRPRELTARIRAVLRRVGNPTPVISGGPSGAGGAVVYGPVCIDTALREVTVRGRPVELSRKEFDLLALLVLEAGHVVTRKQCMDRIWGDRKMGDSRTLDTHVKRLRKKIEYDPADPQHIITVRGIGYRFKP